MQPRASLGTYLLVYLALLGLLVLTVVAAQFDLDRLTGVPLHFAVAIGIAICKAALILLFFMRLGEATRSTQFAAASGLIWFAILLGTVLGDYFNRPPGDLTIKPTSIETRARP